MGIFGLQAGEQSSVRIASQGSSILDFLVDIDYNVIILSKQ